jgi:hypothetical protein
MLMHIVLMRLRPGVGASALSDLTFRLHELAAAISGPGACAIGGNVSEEPFSHGYDFGFALSLPDRATLDAYLVNPAHLAVSLAIRELISDILVYDLET